MTNCISVTNRTPHDEPSVEKNGPPPSISAAERLFDEFLAEGRFMTPSEGSVFDGAAVSESGSSSLGDSWVGGGSELGFFFGNTLAALAFAFEVGCNLTFGVTFGTDFGADFGAGFGAVLGLTVRSSCAT